MKFHVIIKKEAGHKNKLIAQNVGIAVANTTFEMLLDISNHSFLTSWEQPYLLNRAGNDLFMYYGNSPKNLDELKSIANEAAVIEFENLKAAYKGELPVKKFTDSEVVSVVTHLTTVNFLSFMTVQFFAENKTVKSINKVWKDLFVQKHTTDSLLELANKRAMDIFKEKSVSVQNQETVLKNIEYFWTNIKDLKEKLYSSLYK